MERITRYRPPGRLPKIILRECNVRIRLGQARHPPWDAHIANRAYPSCRSYQQVNSPPKPSSRSFRPPPPRFLFRRHSLIYQNLPRLPLCSPIPRQPFRGARNLCLRFHPPPPGSPTLRLLSRRYNNQPTIARTR